MSEPYVRKLIAAIATAFLLAPTALAAGPGEQPNDWPVANPIDAHVTWYNWTLDDPVDYTFGNTTMAGGTITLAPYLGNFSMAGWANSSAAAVSWLPVRLGASLWWWANTTGGETVQINYSWSDDNLSWSPEATVAGNGSAVEVGHGFYRWNATLAAPTNMTTPTLWWVGLRIESNTAPTANAGGDFFMPRNVLMNLNGAASADPDLDAITYQWTQTAGPSTAAITNPTSAVASIQPLENGLFTFELAVFDGWNTTTDTVDVTVQNDPPIANAGPDQNVPVLSNVTLNGSASLDNNGDPITYLWTNLAGPAPVTLWNDTQVLSYFVCPVPGTYNFNLTVTDNQTASSYDWVDINCGNNAPISDAGPDQPGIFKSETVLLDGSASMDPDFDAITYQWTQLSGAVGVTFLPDGTVPMPSFVAPTGAAVTGSYLFNLTVTDIWNASSYDWVDVTISNRAPIADAGLDQFVTGQGATYLLDGTGSSDPDLESVTYSWAFVSGPVPVAVNNPTLVVADFFAPTAGVYVFDLSVSDPDAVASVDSVSVTVSNAPPVAAIAVTPLTVRVGEQAEITANGSVDPDGMITTYDFTYGDAGGSSSAVSWVWYSWAATGTYQVNVTVTDNDTATATASTNVTVVLNQGPTADAGVDQVGVLKGALVQLDGSASSDPEGDTLNFTWNFVTGPTAVTLSDRFVDMPTFTAPTGAGITGVYTFRLVVNDSWGPNSTDFVAITVVNRAPTANAGPDQPGVPKNVAVNLDGTASSDPDVGETASLTFAWSWVSGPVSVTPTPANTATPSFTPTRAGTYVFQLDVTDVDGVTSSDTVSVTVTNILPLANAGPDQSWQKPRNVTLDGSGSTDADDPLLTYSWTGPITVTLYNPTTAMPNFTATQVGTFVFDLTVDDGDGGTDIDQVSVVIWGRAPIANITAAAVIALTGEAVNFTGLLSTDPDGDAITNYTWNMDDGNMTYASLFNYSWATDGFYNVTLTVRDSDGNVSAAVTWMIQITPAAVNNAPVVSAGADQTVTVGTIVTLTGTASDQDGDTLSYAWARTSGPTVTLTNANALVATCTPSTPGTYVFTLTVDDNNGSVVTDSVTVTVDALPNNPPTARAGPDQTVIVGAVVTLNGSASSDPDPGTVLTFSWVRVSGPTAVTTATTERTTFTASAVGTYVFNLTVSDGLLSSSDLVSITVNATPPPPEPSSVLIPILIIVIVVVLILAILLSRRRKKPEAEGEEEMAEEEEEAEEEAAEEEEEEESEEMDEEDSSDVEDK